MARSYKKTWKPGGGKRFAAFVSALKRQGKTVQSARRIAAAAGRRKYGAKKMAKFASKGRIRAKKRKSLTS